MGERQLENRERKDFCGYRRIETQGSGERADQGKHVLNHFFSSCQTDSSHNLTGLNIPVTPEKATLPKYLLSILSPSSGDQNKLVDI